MFKKENLVKNRVPVTNYLVMATEAGWFASRNSPECPEPLAEARHTDLCLVHILEPEVLITPYWEKG